MRKFQAIVHNNSKPYLLFKVANQIPNHMHLTRFLWQQKLNIPQHHKSMLENQFFYNAIKQWNALPVELKLPLPPDAHRPIYKDFHRPPTSTHLHNLHLHTTTEVS